MKNQDCLPAGHLASRSPSPCLRHLMSCSGMYRIDYKLQGRICSPALSPLLLSCSHLQHWRRCRRCPSELKNLLLPLVELWRPLMATSHLCRQRLQLPRSRWAASGLVQLMSTRAVPQTSACRRLGRVLAASIAHHGLPAMLRTMFCPGSCPWCSTQRGPSRQAARRGSRAAPRAARQMDRCRLRLGAARPSS